MDLLPLHDALSACEDGEEIAQLGDIIKSLENGSPFYHRRFHQGYLSSLSKMNYEFLRSLLEKEEETLYEEDHPTTIGIKRCLFADDVGEWSKSPKNGGYENKFAKKAKVEMEEPVSELRFSLELLKIVKTYVPHHFHKN